MAGQLEYVVRNALMVCDKGAAHAFFLPTHNTHIKIQGCLVANKLDKQPLVNIPTFGICSLTQKPCVPGCTDWQKTYKLRVKGQETLLFRSDMPCSLGGKIQFVTSGQVPLPDDAMEDIKALQEQGSKTDEDEGWGWLDAVELIPVVGSIVGAVREGMKGNWGMMAMNIGFLALDIAGLVSFGATTAASSAGTKINTAGGLKNIKEIKTGDKVWSYNELTGETGFQEIVRMMVREIDYTVELYTEEEFIETTAEHPFLTDNSWKDATDLQTGDKIRSRNEEDIEIKDVKFSYRPRKVYNFEVSNWHTYFVGALVWLVHNAEKCISKIFKISRKKYPNHVKLIEEAKREGLPTRLKRGAGKKAAKKNRYEAQKAIRKKQGGPKEGFDYDEYPYASTQQGGKGAKIKEVPSSENQEVGRNLGKFLKIMKLVMEIILI